jgi:enoyl-CoA hydratase
MTWTEIEVLRQGRAGIVRFHRPEALNALTDQMVAETRSAIEQWTNDPDVVAIVLTGSNRAFCTGGDLKRTAGADLAPYDKYRARFTMSEWHEFVRFLHRFPRPVIAAVEGHCLGGGLEIALICDMIVASDSARFGLTEARFGVFPILGGAWSLAQAVGPRLAKELAYTGRTFDAARAHGIGLVNCVTPATGALERAVGLAAEIAECAPLSVTALKQAIDRGGRQSFEEALTAGGELSALLMFSEDRAEGLRAFTEKRRPQFKSR